MASRSATRRAPASRAPPRGGPARPAAGAAEPARPLDAAQAAWLAAVPVALVTALAVYALGPLVAMLYPDRPFDFWTSLVARGAVLPEATEQARYLVALAGPVLLVAATALLARRPPRLARETAELLVGAVQAGGLVFLLGCVANQHAYAYPPLFTTSGSEAHTVYFTVPTLLVAALIAAGILLGARSPRVREAVARVSGESPARLAGATALAVLATAVVLLPAINSDHSIGGTHIVVAYHLQYTFDEAMAVLDGRSPIGDFAAQYGSLWPYLTAAVMSVLGPKLIVFTITMATISGLALLGLFGVLRRLTRSAVLALALFLPLLATSAYMMRGPFENRYSLVNYFGTLPLRYAAPLLLVWLTARHLDGARPRRAWPLYLLGGLAVLNNVDFGVAAVGGTTAALLFASPVTRASLRRLALDALLGLTGAALLVTALVLARAGEPPELGLISAYARLFAVGGFAMLPMKPLIGFSTVIFLTYAAALGTATVRALRREPDRLLTGLLAWSGIFGFGAGAYYMGRSHPEVLINMFPAWAFSVTLLALVTLRGLAAQERPRVTAPAVACLLGLGVLVCSLAQVPRPWSELERVRTAGPAFEFQVGEGGRTTQRFVAAHTAGGEAVVLMMPLSHRVAYLVGVDDVTPYTSPSIFTVEQLDRTLERLREAGGSKVFIAPDMVDDIPLQLSREGFERRAISDNEIELWSDAPVRADE